VNAHHTEKQPSSQSFSGIFPVQKERGETLAVLLERFRSEYTLDDTTKLTYAGRLDPMAEGLVLVLAGESRFQKDTLLGLAKEYEIEVLFGIATDTLDPLGVITETNITPVAEADIQNAIEKNETTYSATVSLVLISSGRRKSVVCARTSRKKS
jgi:tRNA U55 pseudouridine synthase TruB